MSETTEKLSEAKFFLQQLKDNYFEHPAGDYYLSAFISSARSVLWVMRSEYIDANGWSFWYESREPTFDEGLLLRRINEARVRSEKRAPLKTKIRVDFSISAEHVTEELKQALSESVGKPLRVTVRPKQDQLMENVLVDGGMISFTGQVDKVYRVLDEFANDDVLELCTGYYALLDNLVSECESRLAQALAA